MKWEYRTLTITVAAGQGKMPGFFARNQPRKEVNEETVAELNEMGQQGWELISVTMIDYGTYGEGPGHACAFLKRPLDTPG